MLRVTAVPHDQHGELTTVLGAEGSSVGGTIDIWTPLAG
jgi:hypothetical protein